MMDTVASPEEQRLLDMAGYRPLSPDAHHLPGIGGSWKETPDDFLVEEIPAYEPEGQGEHLFLWLEKRDLSGEQLAQWLARELNIRARDIGIAGIKDRRAVTRQYVSVPASCAKLIDGLSDPRVQILHARYHRNKLRRGHLRGNRFSVVLSDVHADSFSRAQSIAAVLQDRGVPNYFGDQRFSRDGDNLSVGYQLLTGRKTPKQLPTSRRRFLMNITLASVQSALFNHVLARRIDEGLFHRVLVGDVMRVVASGGPFRVEDAAREQDRYDRGEIAITGPLFGPKMLKPTGVPDRLECETLEHVGLEEEAFLRFAKQTAGTRRPLRIHPGPIRVKHVNGAVQLQFQLPPGSYATVVLREFIK